ncbi:hypothetical protein MED121_00235 [Marinomonas sp. MED121]|uniref:SLATT domain-containing protein n=1 Tax=Marinomonas sp. MED121 TaxID=314277 RepID=UPI00006905A5|nr:SLATT domain-containing protein [Marinomonas sp. MED121]EAQ63589.1 hypothetical protein MED121_00235 [Marinomonas sp. MED121]
MIDANLSILEQDIQTRITKFKGVSQVNKQKTHFFVMSTAILSSLTTVMIALSQYASTYTIYLSATALLISASLSILTAWDGLYNHKKLWTSYVTALTQLNELQADIQHLKANGEIEQAIINLLYARYKAIIGEVNENWLKLRSESEMGT